MSRPPDIVSFYYFKDGQEPDRIDVGVPAYTLRRRNREQRQKQARQIELSRIQHQPLPPPQLPPPIPVQLYQPPPPKPKRRVLPQDFDKPIQTRSGITAFYYFKDGQEPERKDVGPPAYTVRRRNRRKQKELEQDNPPPPQFPPPPPDFQLQYDEDSVPPQYRFDNLMN